MKTYLKAFRLKRFWLLLLLPAAFLLDFAARQSADFAEWYAVTIYPVYAQFFSAITGVFPFSVGEFCLIALVLFILAYLIHGVYKLIRHKEGRFAYFVRFLSVPVLIATCIARTIAGTALPPSAGLPCGSPPPRSFTMCACI